MYHVGVARCRVLVLLKHLLAYDPGWVATLAQEVKAGICNLFMVLAIACQLFGGTVGCLTSTNECWQIGHQI